MSEVDQEQKTEEPSGKQVSRFREEGDVARSADLSMVVNLLAAVGAIVVFWPFISQTLSSYTAFALGRLDAHETAPFFALEGGKVAAFVILPVSLVATVLTVASLVAQIGWNFTWKPLIPNFGKLNPLPKLPGMFFSGRAVVEILKSLAKIGIVGYVSVNILLEELDHHGRLAGLSIDELFLRLGQIALRIVIHTGVVLIVIAIIDLFYQRYQHHKKMKMTKEETKQEHKDQEGDPIVKRRIRGKQMESARARMLKAVKDASVVVVNPTHYSVAIRYRLAQDAAPIIVALGADHMALKIREKARHLGIPVVSNPPLARALHAKGKVGGYVPKENYRAVAELLAWVYKVTGKVA
ncbi:MAG: EscU/YscU/HrcU family type III secretion system export apparatus switch protein [Myxococcota bacterium]|jgi:flagellar biosynthetic protein FlhB|nr:EscU/YscU/HrcU family type III secretion system export apparatus switch protein [Myxococcota bacterium]